MNRDICNYFEKVRENPLARYMNCLKTYWVNLDQEKSAENLHHKDNRAQKGNVAIKTNVTAIQKIQRKIDIYTTIARKDDYKVFFLPVL